MPKHPRKPTPVVVLEGLLQPYIRDSFLRELVALLVVFCWKLVLAIILIVVALAIGAAIWAVLQ